MFEVALGEPCEAEMPVRALARAGPPEPPRAWLSPLTRGDPAAAAFMPPTPRVDHAALLERLFARVK